MRMARRHVLNEACNDLNEKEKKVCRRDNRTVDGKTNFWCQIPKQEYLYSMQFVSVAVIATLRIQFRI